MGGPCDRARGLDMRRYAAVLGLWIWLVTGREQAPFPDITRPFDHFHDFPVYKSWADGLADFCDRLTDPNSIYVRENRRTGIKLPYDDVEQKITRANFGSVIGVRRGSNHLYLDKGTHYVGTGSARTALRPDSGCALQAGLLDADGTGSAWEAWKACVTSRTIDE